MGVCYGTPDFPTPSNTGSLKSGMKLTISTSSSPAASNSHDSPAARDRKGFGDGKIVADPSLTVFSFAELKKATENFHRNALIGEGGFGCVFKGMLHGKQQSGRTETIIAVKMLNQSGNQGSTEWRRKIDFLGRLSHPNLAKLLGFCQEDTTLALVYEFMPMGSLGNQLFRKGSPAHLPWNIRLKIAVGAARGLAFLHCPERKLIFRDFKTSNILLDASYTAKLSDFGLVRSGPPGETSHISTQFVGTSGYAAPEYLETGRLTVKSDVYGFGIVLLEILTGLRAVDKSRPVGKHLLVEWATSRLSRKKQLRTIMDSRLEGKYYIHSAFQIAQLALKCLQTDPKFRPYMTKVVEELESIEAASAKRIRRKS
ncbi:probable serine/threonine-protein kinase PIX13 isoform X1 [Syzygium oleosum]|uniref:probable serine/threonine-protein kinase PIX13 isoform X1 n=1 Tax=Syzygium oleosum TaxID=219896 RepID=UPI0011D2B275|nr:probable serine/threonine-protein kinase PIX13 isoform X1 [Syzygium oleosum]